METRNITFNLPTELIRKAKIYAAQHDTTVNSVIRELLQEKLSADSRTRSAAERLMAIADAGPYFTSDPSAIRSEDLHDRRG